MPSEDPQNWIYNDLDNLFPLLTQFAMDQWDTLGEFPVRSLANTQRPAGKVTP